MSAAASGVISRKGGNNLIPRPTVGLQNFSGDSPLGQNYAGQVFGHPAPYAPILNATHFQGNFVGPAGYPYNSLFGGASQGHGRFSTLPPRSAPGSAPPQDKVLPESSDPKSQLAWAPMLTNVPGEGGFVPKSSVLRFNALTTNPYGSALVFPFSTELYGNYSSCSCGGAACTGGGCGGGCGGASSCGGGGGGGGGARPAPPPGLTTSGKGRAQKRPFAREPALTTRGYVKIHPADMQKGTSGVGEARKFGKGKRRVKKVTIKRGVVQFPKTAPKSVGGV